MSMSLCRRPRTVTHAFAYQRHTRWPRIGAVNATSPRWSTGTSSKTSPMQHMLFRGCNLTVKRDDLLTLTPKGISCQPAIALYNRLDIGRVAKTSDPLSTIQALQASYSTVTGLEGNKARKLIGWLGQLQRGDTVVSHGGNQSNSMLALAQMCCSISASFVYHTVESAGHPATATQSSSVSNLQRVLDSGACVFFHSTEQAAECAARSECRHTATYSSSSDHRLEEAVHAREATANFSGHSSRRVFVPRGGHCTQAQVGIAALARELVDWFCSQQGHQSETVGPQDDTEHSDAVSTPSQGDRRLVVALPCGCGTTAAFLAQALYQTMPMRTIVLAIPTVSDENHLRESMTSVLGNNLPPNLCIINAKTRFGFARLHPRLLRLYTELVRNGIHIDLIYGVRAFAALWDNDVFATSTRNGDVLVYYHTGGLAGNVTMLSRYVAKYGASRVVDLLLEEAA